ncbi:hypothetical protein H0Z09_17350 [Pseudomonas sp. SWRI18]|uniref:hypothetical protein n=1 Tax=Pseudomonas sp. SWRI18 TaxID=2753888 RepID=UPI001645D17A|nr:hypothetical protein [Pseudomonas sp. SWRI18]MBC3302899.1 hypothetical protein [Pseudomonas sp. SWRI18]
MSYVNLRQETPFYGNFNLPCEQPRVSCDNNDICHAPNSVVAQNFAANFGCFPSADGFVTRETLLEFAARRLPTGNPFEDGLVKLASTILERPELNCMLDAINHGGSVDGRISMGDVMRTIDHCERQEAPPMREFPGRYSGALMRQRLENEYAPQRDWQQPAFSAPRYADETRWSSPMSASGQRPYANDSKQELLDKILARFSSFEDPNSPGLITDKSLNAVASGYRLDGQPATQAERDLASELLERGDVFKELDRSSMGVLDGAFSRGNLDFSSNKYRNMSDHDLIQGIKDNFRQYTAGADDQYINVNELKEAAGLTPSNRTFSTEARELATQLLNRPGLLRDLDIGTNNQGGPGYEDRRFDMDNLNFMLDNGRVSV